MRVTVRLFAQLRERAGASELSIERPEGARVKDAIDELGGLAGGLPVVMAVNREYADGDAPLAQGDELALIPPVSGGAGPWTRVTGEPLDAAALIERVRDSRAGALVVFEGVTRDVERLEYEAYAEMAEPRIEAILRDCAERHGLQAVAAEHRVGEVPLGEPSVIVAVSAAHRDEAFAAAREAIDRIKAEAPIWKVEVDAAGVRTRVEGSLPPTLPNAPSG